MHVRRRTTTLLAGGAGLLLVGLAVAGCGGASASTPPKTASGKPATVGVANDSLGKVLVDSQGRTLYLFTKDAGTTSACTGACATNWPPLLVSGMPTVGGGAQASMVSTSARSNGQVQLVYNGHPLYLFKNDGKAGDTNGEGLNAFGGNWFAVSSVGSQISAPAAGTGGGGYGGGY
jgi:predicted lipoprotein with Yx(FWY)xxD motif